MLPIDLQNIQLPDKPLYTTSLDTPPHVALLKLKQNYDIKYKYSNVAMTIINYGILKIHFQLYILWERNQVQRHLNKAFEI